MTQKWISVAESLPDFDVPVFLYSPDGGMWLGGRSDEYDGWLWGNIYGCVCYKKSHGSAGCWLCHDLGIDDDYRPTFWMALPEPPVVDAPDGEKLT